MEPCQSNHEQIMSELARINKRMDDDWPLIKASDEDRVFRQRLWNVIKWVGFGSASGAVYKLLEFIVSK